MGSSTCQLHRTSMKTLSRTVIDWFSVSILYHSELNRANSNGEAISANRSGRRASDPVAAVGSSQYKGFAESVRYMPTELQGEIIFTMLHQWNRLTCDVLRMFTFFGTSLTTLDLKGAACTGDNEFSSIVSSLGDQLEHLSLEDCLGLTDASIIQMSKKITHLKYLNLSGTNLQDKAVQFMLSASGGLHYLHLNRCLSISDDFLGGKELPELLVLSLDGCAQLTSSHRIGVLCTGLQRLSLRRCVGISDVRRITEQCKELRSLDLGVTLLGDLVDIAENCKGLIELVVDECPPVNNTSMMALFPPASLPQNPCTANKLERLNFTGKEGNDDVTFLEICDMLTAHCHELRELQIDGVQLSDTCEYFDVIERLKPLLSRLSLHVNMKNEWESELLLSDPWNFQMEFMEELDIGLFHWNCLENLASNAPLLRKLHIQTLIVQFPEELTEGETFSLNFPEFGELEEVKLSLHKEKSGDTEPKSSLTIESNILRKLSLTDVESTSLVVDLPFLEYLYINNVYPDNYQIEGLGKIEEISVDNKFNADMLEDIITRSATTLTSVIVDCGGLSGVYFDKAFANSLQSATQLRTLKMLGRDKQHSDQLFLDIRNNNKALQYLELQSTYGCKSEVINAFLTNEPLSRNSNPKLLTDMTSAWTSPLRSLKIERAVRLKQVQVPAGNLSPNLQTLSLEQCPNLSQFTIEGNRKKSKNNETTLLSQISLTGCVSLSSVDIDCNSLLSLKLDTCEKLKSLRLRCPKLRHLSLNNSSGVSEADLLEIITQNPQLQYLGVRGHHCTQSNNPEMINAAKKNKGLTLDRGKIAEPQRFPKRSTR
ncbi:hypothetical protein PROFUN_01191 [Planoprotostelium fungivorum]|uniref:Uncharacterized protein n=1 Tax=Planoprotostelium fungivorum TaxID=1890364 RepID=A0A2P6NCJ0_9EUKA|nr:hypothetical protein PROFUN_01191 [Planoprotostelium fungivorum]